MIIVTILIMILGGDSTRIGCIDVSPEGTVIFRGQGATDVPLLRIIEQRSSRDERERVGNLIHEYLK